MSPDNIVRVSYPWDSPWAGGPADKHRRAHETLDRWLAEGLWAREEAPAIYPYTQSYRAGGHEVTRVGFVALGEVTDYARGVALPHERTHAGPKQDRMRHLETTGADIGLIFMLTADPGGVLREATAGEGAPIAEARDLRGELHRLWRLGDVEAIRRVEALMAPAQVIIADGHHRYETAVEYRRRHPAAEDKLMAFSILHEGLLRPLLDIDDAKLDARTHVDYTADQDEAVREARGGRYQAAFLIAPTTPEELQAVVRGGEVLPQKSTHFYPKLLDGLVFHRLEA